MAFATCFDRGVGVLDRSSTVPLPGFPLLLTSSRCLFPGRVLSGPFFWESIAAKQPVLVQLAHRVIGSSLCPVSSAGHFLFLHLYTHCQWGSVEYLECCFLFFRFFLFSHRGLDRYASAFAAQPGIFSTRSIEWLQCIQRRPLTFPVTWSWSTCNRLLKSYYRRLAADGAYSALRLTAWRRYCSTVMSYLYRLVDSLRCRRRRMSNRDAAVHDRFGANNPLSVPYCSGNSVSVVILELLWIGSSAAARFSPVSNCVFVPVCYIPTSSRNGVCQSHTLISMLVAVTLCIPAALRDSFAGSRQLCFLLVHVSSYADSFLRKLLRSVDTSDFCGLGRVL